MYLERYTMDGFKAISERVDTVIIPVGSTEAHGYHLPLGTDMLVPRELLRRLELAYGDNVWIAPEVAYSPCFTLPEFPGTVNIPSDVLADYLFHIGANLYKHGMRKIVFLNGHGENHTALNLAGEKLSELGAYIWNSNPFNDFAGDFNHVLESRFGSHANECETALLMACDETLAHMDKVVVNMKKVLMGVRYKDRYLDFIPEAVHGDGTKATKEKGDKILDYMVKGLVRQLESLESGRYND
ncbi:MAG: creatininase family protein [Oscillospiraceae bacterium]|nr:creatininase family protein [Oscillospiraceae bacterium]